MNRSLSPLLISCAWFALSAGVARADDAGAASAPPNGAPSPSIASTYPRIADPGGIRTALAAKGITFQLNEIGELWGDVSGGAKRGAVYDNRLELVIDADLEKLMGWKGGAVHLNGYWIEETGGGISASHVGNLLDVSNIEARPTVRLYEAWFEQKFLDDKIALRFGQLGVDTEFVTSKYAGLFINGTYGWPGIAAADLPSGGPAYPLATPGARLKLTPNDQFAFLLGAFNGDPAGQCGNDPQTCNRNGVNFRLQDPPLVIEEGDYAYSLSKTAGLDGTVKLGAWEHLGRFGSPRFDNTGGLLADPASSGVARQFSGNDGVYAVIDQMVYHPRGADPGYGVGVFARISGSPSDRNLVDVYADGGVNFTGMIAARPNDSFGVAFGYAHISNVAAQFDDDTNAFTGVAAPVRNDELNIEATYQFQIVPGFTIQPDLQYIVHPGGNVVNPFGNGLTPIKDALVVGARATINY